MSEGNVTVFSRRKIQNFLEGNNLKFSELLNFFSQIKFTPVNAHSLSDVCTDY